MGGAGYTFGFPITWFEELGAGVVSDAAYGDPYFLAGFWQIGDPTGLVIADAAGQPVVVHGMYGDGRVTFIGSHDRLPCPHRRLVQAAGQRDLHRQLADDMR